MQAHGLGYFHGVGDEGGGPVYPTGSMASGNMRPPPKLQMAVIDDCDGAGVKIQGGMNAL